MPSIAELQSQQLMSASKQSAAMAGGQESFKAVSQETLVAPTSDLTDRRSLATWVAYLLTIAAATEPAALLTAIKTVDGAGSGLDADLLDGSSSAAFAAASHVHDASAITNTPAGNIAATNVQAAINELDTEKASLTGATFTGTLNLTATQPQISFFDSDVANLVTAVYHNGFAFVISSDLNNVQASSQIIFQIDGGSNVAALYGGGGLLMNGATGGNKGAGTINATAVYDDNVLLTCMAMAKTFAEKGTFTDEDVAEWDARVPDMIEPASTERRPVMVTVAKAGLVRDDDGSMKVATVELEQQKTEPVPVYAEDGLTGIDMIEEPVFETVEVPEKVTPRTHPVARVFKAMVDDGFDPRDPAAYIAKMRADEALPGMPTKDGWEHNGLSSGEMLSRLWLATEMLALAFATLTERVAALEAR